MAKNKEGSGILIFLPFLLVAFAAIVLYLLKVTGMVTWNIAPSKQEQQTSLQILEEEEAALSYYSLFFRRPDHFELVMEERLLECRHTPHDIGNAVLRELFAGPIEGNGIAVCPEGILLRAFFLQDNGRCVVDLEIPEGVSFSEGVMQEALLVAAIVKTLAFNLEPVQNVRFLINGQPRELLGSALFLGQAFTTEQVNRWLNPQELLSGGRIPANMPSDN